MNITKSLIAASALSSVLGSARAEVTANIGFLSDYIFRGVPQAASVANGGVDFAKGGFYLGTWAAAVKPGLEVDLYGGYVHEWDSGFSLGAGFTGYYYTDDFDDTYQEINLYGGYKFLSVEYAVGDYENFDGPTLDYDYAAVSAEYEGFYAKFATFGKDFDGDYLEFGYSTEVAGFEVGGSIIRSSKEISGNEDSNGLPTEDTFFVFSINKSFGLMD